MVAADREKLTLMMKNTFVWGEFSSMTRDEKLKLAEFRGSYFFELGKIKFLWIPNNDEWMQEFKQT